MIAGVSLGEAEAEASSPVGRRPLHQSRRRRKRFHPLASQARPRPLSSLRRRNTHTQARDLWRLHPPRWPPRSRQPSRSSPRRPHPTSQRGAAAVTPDIPWIASPPRAPDAGGGGAPPATGPSAPRDATCSSWAQSGAWKRTRPLAHSGPAALHTYLVRQTIPSTPRSGVRKAPSQSRSRVPAPGGSPGPPSPSPRGITVHSHIGSATFQALVWDGE